jgi:hypothetical protein
VAVGALQGGLLFLLTVEEQVHDTYSILPDADAAPLYESTGARYKVRLTMATRMT